MADFEKYQLPSMPSALLRVAVQDAKLAEQDPTVRLDMGRYVYVYYGATIQCGVCIAGAVMLRMNRQLALQSEGPGRFVHLLEELSCAERDRLVEQLYAIDHMRVGQFRLAVEGLGKVPSPCAETLEEVSVFVRKHVDRNLEYAPWDIYLQAADMLEAGGL